MTTDPSEARVGGARDAWRRPFREIHGIDLAVYTAIAGSPTPSLDNLLRRLSGAANYSRLSLAAAAALAIGGGPDGRRAAARGLASVAVTSTIMNLAIKPLASRRRPDRPAAAVPPARHVDMPESHSFPSGHAAAAFAFAAGAGRTLSWTAPPLTALAAVVAYSRLHTGVHYPTDVIAGSLCGVALAEATNRMIDRFARS